MPIRYLFKLHMVLTCGVLLVGALVSCKSRERPAASPDRGLATRLPDLQPPPPKPDAWPAAARLSRSLGAPAIGTLRAPRTVQTAPLKREAVARAEAATFTSRSRVVGHPAAALRDLTAEQAEQVGRLLTDDASYLFDGPVNRCANRSWLGLRFDGASGAVEVALGKPCDQILFAWTAPDTKRWGARMTAAAAERLRGLLAPTK